MEIPMAAVIDSYRQQLSDAVHQITILKLHIKTLGEEADKAKKTIDDLQATVDMYRISQSGEDLSEEPDDWGEDYDDD
jgi:FtsZ-binding cell division protein ZapB